MKKTLHKILADIKSGISIDFALLDEKNECFFGNVANDMKKTKIKLFGRKFSLLVDISEQYTEDFVYFLKHLVKNITDRILIDFLKGKDKIRDFHFPCGILIIQCDNIQDVTKFIDTFFNRVYVLYEDNLVMFFHMESINELKETAQALYQTIREEVTPKVIISIADIAHSQNQLIKNYHQAVYALSFRQYIKNKVLYYPEMFLERLLLSVPKHQQQKFKREFDNKFKNLDHETINTIKTVLDCNLNLAEASRRLYIHRNTLMYRLDKIKKLTNLDLRNFKDAMKVQMCLILNELY